MSAQSTLLLVDDEPAQVLLVTAIAHRAGWRTLAVPDAGKARTLLADGVERVHALLVDLWRPGEGGATAIAALRARWPELPILVLTAQASIGLAVEAMRAGASDFLLKPIAPGRLLAALDAAAAPHGRGDELRPLAEQVEEPLGFDGIVGSAPLLRAALAQAALAARSRAPGVIIGAAGTGKELVARAIHAASGRSRRAPLMVDARALARGQAEWELFGHAEGPVVAAFRGSAGQLARLDGGTLILAHPAALGETAQRLLTGLIEDGRLPASGNRPARLLDVRVLALSEHPPAHDAAAGRLLPDLAAALGGQEIRLPSLAERSGDIPALARHLLARIGTQPGLSQLALGEDAERLLTAHPWPGNVRQLHDVLFRAAIAAEGDVLRAEHFPRIADTAVPAAPPVVQAAGVELYDGNGHLRPLEEIEADIIRLAIGVYGGRMSEVARRLRIGRSTLYRKLAELGLDNAA